MDAFFKFMKAPFNTRNGSSDRNFYVLGICPLFFLGRLSDINRQFEFIGKFDVCCWIGWVISRIRRSARRGIICFWVQIYEQN